MKDEYRLSIPRLHILTHEKLELIHLSTLELLRRTGVLVKEPKALRIFGEGGCSVEGERVRIPCGLVEWALRNASPRIGMGDRHGKPAMFLEENNTYFGTGSDTPHIVDPYTGERRPAVLADIENVSRVVDGLDQLSFVMCSGIASDVNPAIADLHHFKAMVGHTEKPIVFTAWNVENLEAIIKMAEMVVGGEAALRMNPFIALYTEPISPLTLARESTQKLMLMAEKRLPVIFAPSVITGGTGPVTLAGGLVQGNAEALAGLVLANLVHPGTPFIHGGSGEPMDMATMLMSYAAPESMMVVSAWADLARFYKLPVFSYAGCSDSNLYDQQASLESALWILVSTLSGGNLVHDVGYIDNGLTTSFEQLVVSDEVIGMVRRIAQGIEVNEETMALDLIDKTGPGGEYLTSEHTLKHFKENWVPSLISRQPYEKWEKGGRKDLGARARERARYLLESHRPRPLDDKLKMELRTIVGAMDK
jgi:trimethylamine--corrinoid protein Co-methyltransferase